MEQRRKKMNATNTIVTIQKTSKKYKFRLVIAWLMMIVSVIWYMGAKSNANLTGEPANLTKPGLLFGGGILLWLLTKIAIWWNHE